MVSHVDVLLVALGTIDTDARTRNLARALSNAGYAVAVIAAGMVDGVHMFSWDDPGGSAFVRWKSLQRYARTVQVHANTVFGMDLFALQAAQRIARRCKARLYYDMREFYFALGPLEGRGWKQKLIAWHERMLLKHVDQVIVSGYLDAGIIQKRFRLPKPPHILLNTPPWQERVQSSYLRDTFSSPTSAVVVQCQGVVHHGRGIAPFFKAMLALPNVHLCVVGDGPAKQQLQNLSMSLQLDQRVHWHDVVDYDKLHAITCSADIGLCLIEPVSESYRYALPNKLFEYMMAGVPVLANDLPALREQLVRMPCGVLVDEALSVQMICEGFERLQVPATYQAMQRVCARVRTVSYEYQARHVSEQLL